MSAACSRHFALLREWDTPPANKVNAISRAARLVFEVIM